MSKSTTTLRLEQKLLEDLKVEAKKDNRSVNNIINKILDSYIKDRKSGEVKSA